MKTLKYRSAFAGLMVATLSVFLFTACEKESDGEPIPPKSRLEKFLRLTFSSGSTSTSTSSTSSGTFTGGGGSLTYTPPTGGSNASFTSTESDGPAYTDPKSRGNTFSVNSSFGEGGGSFSIDGKEYKLALAFCSDAIFGPVGFSVGDTASESKLFVGIATNDGELDFSGLGDAGNADQSGNFPIDALVYVWSFGGSSDIGSFDSFENDDRLRGSFVFVVDYPETYDPDQMGDPWKFYFATSGSASFDGDNVLLAGVELQEIDLNNDGKKGKTVDLLADFSCIAAPEEE